MATAWNWKQNALHILGVWKNGKTTGAAKKFQLRNALGNENPDIIQNQGLYKGGTEL